MIANRAVKTCRFLFCVGLICSCNLELIPEAGGGPTGDTFELYFAEGGTTRGFDLVATQDGNYVIVGEITKMGTSNTDMVLIKVDPNGVEVWDNYKTFGGAGNDSGKAIKETGSGDLVITGETTVGGNAALFFVRTFADGSARVEMPLDGGATSSGSDLIPLDDGGTIFVGTTNLCALPSVCDHMWFFKVNSNNEIVGNNDGYGSGIRTIGSGIAAGTSDGILAVGNQFNDNQEKANIFLAYQPFSTFTLGPQTKILPETGDQSANAAAGLIDNTFVVIGESENNAGGPSDILFLRVSSDLNLVNNPVLIGGAGTERGNDVALTKDGGLILVGETTSEGAGGSDVYLVKTDINGNVAWTATHGGPFKDVGEAVIPTDDGGYLVVGHSQITSDPKNVAIYLIKTDSRGRVE